MYKTNEKKKRKSIKEPTFNQQLILLRKEEEKLITIVFSFFRTVNKNHETSTNVSEV